jgi:DNA (cytosine-5)-methyltransferase 1
MIPVIDIFAGPGGLGEGFTSCKDAQGRRRFALGLSIEKDAVAHATLRLRSFRRQFGRKPPEQYDRYIRSEVDWHFLKSCFPLQAEKAERESQRIELGAATVTDVRGMIRRAIAATEEWVLIGGPPCQAYSLAGRARNNGKSGYRADLDLRQTLYVEYLQVLADHGPPVFVMENVKGLLSASLHDSGMFDRIREDLREPSRALSREHRSTLRRGQKYEIRALVAPLDLLGDDPVNYLVHAERFGIPQRRHRVILVGVREDLAHRQLRQLTPVQGLHSVHGAIGDLPKLRSGLSRTTDSRSEWVQHLRAVRNRKWLREVAPEVRRRIKATLGHLGSSSVTRGSDYVQTAAHNVVLNHSTRGHMVTDLERYLFASSYAAVTGVSPTLQRFPAELLPAHENVQRALGNGLFADRFRVQVADQPSTTITSHISKDGHYYIHPDSSQCRSLTVREAARLQTFPDDYFFCGPRTAQYHQVGNAVPPFLARQIADAVAELMGA